MKSKSIKIIAITVMSLIGLVSFQNCGKIQPGLSIADQQTQFSSVQPDSSNVNAVVTDETGQVSVVEPPLETPIEVEIPVDESTDNAPIVKSPHEPVCVKAPCEGPKSLPSHEEEKDDDIVPPVASASDCAELAKKYKEPIDIAKLKSRFKIDLLKGKNFIYSSDPSIQTIEGLKIGKSCGRTILCGITVSKIGKKNGRLDLIHSHVEKLDEDHGVVVKDEHSSCDKH